MSSKGYSNDTDESSVIRERLRELREEFDALVRQGGNAVSARYGDDGGLADLRSDIERVRHALEPCGPEMAIPSPPYAVASANPPFPPFPPFAPYPPFPPVAPFPPYPPYPANCGCCAPAPCGCPKCSGHVASAASPVTESAPPPSPVIASSSSSPARNSSSNSSSSSSESSRGPIVIRLPPSSSSSRYLIK
jgi:hypothetical protein